MLCVRVCLCLCLCLCACACACVCFCLCVHVHMVRVRMYMVYACEYVYMHVRICMHVCTCMYARVYVYVCTCVRVCMHVCACMYARVYVYVCTCVRVCKHVDTAHLSLEVAVAGADLLQVAVADAAAAQGDEAGDAAGDLYLHDFHYLENLEENVWSKFSFDELRIYLILRAVNVYTPYLSSAFTNAKMVFACVERASDRNGDGESERGNGCAM